MNTMTDNFTQATAGSFARCPFAVRKFAAVNLVVDSQNQDFKSQDNLIPTDPLPSLFAAA